MKKALPYITAGLLILSVFLLQRQCGGPDPAYYVARAKYDTDVKNQRQRAEAALDAIAEKDALLAEKDAAIAAADLKITQLKATSAGQAATGRELAAENAELKANAEAAINANPAVKALVDNYDLRCANYEQQILTLGQTIKVNEQKCEDLRVEVVAVKYQRDQFKRLYDDEHALRLASDSLRIDLEHQVKSQGKWKWVAALGTVAGFVLGGVTGK